MTVAITRSDRSASELREAAAGTQPGGVPRWLLDLQKRIREEFSVELHENARPHRLHHSAYLGKSGHQIGGAGIHRTAPNPFRAQVS
jgi:hypothetical protein